MKISLIVAHGNNYELGLNNQLLWNIPDDLKKFKELTTGHHILMGRKTFESIGRPLPNRVSLIISRSRHYENNDMNNVFSFPTFDMAIESAMDRFDNELFIIGGAQIYNEYIHRADTLYISEVDYDGEADAYLKPIVYENYQLVEEEFYSATETSPAWRFKRLDKIINH